MLTIIVPVYNSMSYLDLCIQSILDQTYTNFELLLINDGSTDDSGKICEEYAKNDKRIKVFHQKNKGQGSARNLGLDNANGDYIMFVDSDDAISEDTLILNLKILQKNPEIECVQFPYFKKYGTHKALLQQGKEMLYTKDEDFIKLTIEKSIITWLVCDKIYRKELLNNLRFREDIKYEDNYFIMELIQKLSNLFVSEQGVYYYYYRDESTTTSAVSELKERSTLEVLYLILSLLSSRKYDELFYKYLVRVINVQKSLKVNFDIKTSTEESNKYKNRIEISKVFKANLGVKDKFKLLFYKFS